MKGQITLFVIIAILIVAGAGIYAYFSSLPVTIPSKLMPVENKISECIADVVNEGTDILGEQAGYIELPEFEPASEYIPFGSQFNFFGSRMPYWFYKFGNNIYKEQVPAISLMTKQLQDYINQNIANCDFSQFQEQNYAVDYENKAVSKVTIRDKQIAVELDWPVTIAFEDAKQRVVKHTAEVDNTLGEKYSIAKKIYDKEKNSLFFENYTIDVLTLYAPGTDVEFRCAPRVWNKQKVISDIKEALKANLQTIKFSGSYYDLRDQESKYFVNDLGDSLKNQVNVIYDTNFPTVVEIDPSEGDVMRVDPVGMQEGLSFVSLLGVCYVPYHFVYSVSYPVIVQIFDENYKMFQFPMIVEIKNNLPRGAVIGEQVPEPQVQLCDYKIQNIEVYVSDSYGKPIDASISFKCHSTICNIGETKDGYLNGLFPQCVNGFLIAESENYSTTKLQISTNEAASADIIMQNSYELAVEPLKDQQLLSGKESALVVFRSDDYSASVYWPEQKTIKLISGVYNVTAYLFADKEMTLQAQTKEQCVKVPAGGLLGVFGLKTEKCYNIETPAQKLSQITFGGGNMEVPLSDDELASSKKVLVSIKEQKIPETQDDLQGIYDLISQSTVEVSLT